MVERCDSGIRRESLPRDAEGDKLAAALWHGDVDMASSMCGLHEAEGRYNQAALVQLQARQMQLARNMH